MTHPDFNPYQPPVPAPPESVPQGPAPDPALTGLGGWLVLVGLGVIVAPLANLKVLIESYRSVFMGNAWARLTTPGAEHYHPLYGPFIIAEFAFNVAMLLLSVYLIYLFFSKMKGFPKWYIRGTLLTLAFQVIDPLAFQYINPSSPAFDAESGKELGRNLVSALIWIPYMIQSRRVAATFIR